MKETLSRIDIVKLANVLASKDDVKSFKLSYAMDKTLTHLLAEIKASNEAQKKNKEYAEYDKKRVELAKRYSRKDEKGQPLTLPGTNNYELESPVEFSEQWEKLKEEYKEVLEKYNAFMNEDKVEVEIHKVKAEVVPSDFDVRGMTILIED